MVCAFLQFATTNSVSNVVVWTDGAMSDKPYPLRNPTLATCDCFVPELVRWAENSS
jgi:hypothetical protein